MAKGKKPKTVKPHPQYEETIAINASFDEVLQILSDAAHENNGVKIEEPLPQE